MTRKEFIQESKDKMDNPNYTTAPTLQEEFERQKKAGELVNGWLVLWTWEMDKMSKFSSGSPEYEDESQIFIDYDEGVSPYEQARFLYDQLRNGLKDNDNQKCWSANLCEIKESTEATYTEIPNL